MKDPQKNKGLAFLKNVSNTVHSFFRESGHLLKRDWNFLKLHWKQSVVPFLHRFFSKVDESTRHLFHRSQDNVMQWKQRRNSSSSTKPEPESTEESLVLAEEEKIDKEPNNQEEANVQEEKGKSSSSLWHSFIFGFNVTYNVIRNLILIIAIFLIIGGAFAAGTGAGLFASLVSGQEPPSYEEMKTAIGDVSQTSSMYYASGEMISDFRSDLKRTSIPLDQMSDYIVNGIIATEDEYFREHKGVVPKAIMRALVQQVMGSSVTSGGSTLTQQLVKQQILSSEVTFERKVNEILIAYRLENYFSKDEILQSYLNISPFGRNNHGNNIAGVHEAATGIFGVEASELSLPQAAFIAGLPQNPIVYSPYTNSGQIKEDVTAGLSRKNEVLFRMYREGYISEDEYKEAKAYDLTQDFLSREDTDAKNKSYLYDEVEKQAREIVMEQLYTADGKTAEDISKNKDLYDKYYEMADDDMRLNGYQVYSTIDKPIYDAFQQVAANYGYTLGRDKTVTYKDKNGRTKVRYEEDPETGEKVAMKRPAETGVQLLDNTTGAIIAFVGGRDYESNMYNHAFTSHRQPGSTIKPLVVYAPAIEEGILTPASIIPDTRLFVKNGNEYKEITNVGKRVSGTNVDARTALSKSMNIPTTRIFLAAQESGDPTKYLPLMGIGTDSIPESDYQNASLALGGTSNGPTILEQTSAFTTFANGGVHTDPYLIEKIENGKGEVIYQHETKQTKVFSPETAYLTLDMMRDAMNSGTGKGTKDWLNFNADIYGKTGTTSSQRDIWFIGSTPNITLSSWTGYDDNMSIDTEGGTSASIRNRRYWARLMNAIYETNPTVLGTDLTFKQPEGIKTETVLTETGMKPGEVTVPSGSVAAAQKYAEQRKKSQPGAPDTSAGTWLPDGTKITINGDTKQDIFSSHHLPGVTKYNFLIHGPADEQNLFWKNKR